MPKLRPEDIQPVSPTSTPNPEFVASQERGLRQNPPGHQPQGLSDAEMGLMYDRGFWKRTGWEFTNENTFVSLFTNMARNSEWDAIFDEKDLDKKGGALEFLAHGNNRNYIEVLSGQDPNSLLMRLDDGATARDLLSLAQSTRTVRQRERDREDTPHGWKTIADFTTVGLAAIIDPVNAIPIAWVGKTTGVRDIYYAARAARANSGFHRWGTPLYGSMDWMMGSAAGAAIAEVPLAFTAGDRFHRDPVTNTIMGGLFGGVIGGLAGGVQGLRMPQAIPENAVRARERRAAAQAKLRQEARDRKRIARGEGPEVLAERAIQEAEAAVSHAHPESPLKPKPDEADEAATQIGLAAEGLKHTRKADQNTPVPPTTKAVKLADELGVDIKEVNGTGAKGRVTVGDVKNFVKSKSGMSEVRTKDDGGTPIKSGDEVIIIDESGVRNYQIPDKTGLAVPEGTVVMKTDKEPTVFERAKDAVDEALKEVRQRRAELEERINHLYSSDEATYGISKEAQDRIDVAVAKAKDQMAKNKAIVDAAVARGKGKGRGATKWTAEETSAKKALARLSDRLKNLEAERQQRFPRKEALAELDGLEKEVARLQDLVEAVDRAAEPEMLVKMINDYEPEHMRAAEGHFELLNYQIKTDPEFAEATLAVLKDMHEVAVAKKAELAARIQDIEHQLRGLKEKSPDYKKLLREYHALQQHNLFDFTMLQGYRDAKAAAEKARAQSLQDKFVELEGEHKATDTGTQQARTAFEDFQSMIEKPIKSGGRDTQWTRKDYRAWKAMKREVARMVGERKEAYQKALDEALEDVPGFEDVKGNMHAQLALLEDVQLLSKDLGKMEQDLKGKLRDKEELLAKLEDDTQKLEDMRDAEKKAQGDDDTPTMARIDLEERIIALDTRVAAVSDDVISIKGELEKIEEARDANEVRRARADAIKGAIGDGEIKLPTNKTLWEMQQLQLDMIKWEESLIKGWAKSTLDPSSSTQRSNFVEMMMDDDSRTWYLKSSQEEWRAMKKAQEEELARRRENTHLEDFPEEALPDDVKGEIEIDDSILQAFDALLVARQTENNELYGAIYESIQDYFSERHLNPEDLAMADLKVEHQEVLTWFYADKVGQDLVDRVMDTYDGKTLSAIDFRAKFGEEIENDSWWDAIYKSGRYADNHVSLLKSIFSPHIRAHLLRFLDVVNPEYRDLIADRLKVLVLSDYEYRAAFGDSSGGMFITASDTKGMLAPVRGTVQDNVLLNLATTIRRSNGAFDFWGDAATRQGVPEGGFTLIKDKRSRSLPELRDDIFSEKGKLDYNPSELRDIGNKIRAEEARNVTVMIHEINHFLFDWTVPEREKVRAIEYMKSEWVTMMRRARKLEKSGKGAALDQLVYDVEWVGGEGEIGKRSRKKYYDFPLWFNKLSYYADYVTANEFNTWRVHMGDPPNYGLERLEWFHGFIESLSDEKAEYLFRVILEEYVVDSVAHTFINGHQPSKVLLKSSALDSLNFLMLNRLRWFGAAKGHTYLGHLTRNHMLRVHRGYTKFDTVGKRNGLELAKAELADRDIRRRLSRKIIIDEIERQSKLHAIQRPEVTLFRRYFAINDNPGAVYPTFRSFIELILKSDFFDKPTVGNIVYAVERWLDDDVAWLKQHFGVERPPVQMLAEDLDRELTIAMDAVSEPAMRYNIRTVGEELRRWDNVAEILNRDFEGHSVEWERENLWVIQRALQQEMDWRRSYQNVYYDQYRTSGSLTDLIQERLLNRQAIMDVLEVSTAELAERHSKPNGWKTPVASIADFIRLKAIADREISGSIIDNAPDDFAAEIANALFDDTAVVFGDATPRGGVRAEHVRWSFIAQGIETQKLVKEAWIRHRRVAGMEPSAGGKLIEKATGAIRVEDEVYTKWFNDILNHLEKGTDAPDKNMQAAVEAMRKMYDNAYTQFTLSGVVPNKKARPTNPETGHTTYAPHLWDSREVRANKEKFVDMVMEELRRKIKADEFDPLEVRQQAEEIWRNITETGITYSSKAMSGLHIHIGKRTGDRVIHMDEPWKFREAGFFEKDPQKYIHRFAATWGGKHATNAALAQRFGIELEEGLARLLDGRSDVIFNIEAGENFRRMIKNARKKKAKNRDPIEHQLVEAVKAKAPDNPIKDVWYAVAGNRDLRSEVLKHMHANFEVNLARVKDKRKQRTLGIEQKRYAERLNDMMNRLEGAIVDDAGDPVVGSVVDTLNSGMVSARLGKLPLAMLQEMSSHAFMKLIPGDTLQRHIWEIGKWWRAMTPEQQKVMQQIIKRIDPWRLRGVGEEIGNIGDRARSGLDPAKPGQRVAGAVQDLARDAAQTTFNVSGAAKVEELQRLLAAKIMHNEMVTIFPRYKKAALMAGEGRMTPEILRDAGIQDPRAWYEYNKLGWTVEKIDILESYRTVDPDGWVFYNIDELRRDAQRLASKTEGKNSEEAIAIRRRAALLYEVADTYHGSMRNRVDAMVVTRNINSTPTYAHNSKAFGALFTSLRGFSLNYQNKFNRVAHQRGEVQLGSYFAQAMAWGIVNLMGIKVINGDADEEYLTDILEGRGTWSFLMESSLRTGISAGWFGDLLTTLYYNGNADAFMTPAAVGWGQDVFNQIYKTGYGIMDFVGFVDHDETSAGYWPVDTSAAGKKNTEGFLNALPIMNLWQIDTIINNAVMTQED